MKKIFFYLTLCYSTLIFAQEWSPSTATVNTNIFRNASVGIGYTTAPTFGTNKLLVNGNAFVSGKLGVGISNPTGIIESRGGLPNGTSFSSIDQRNEQSIVLNIGSLVGSSTKFRNIKFFDFPQSNFDALSTVYFGIEDRNDFGRFRVIAQTGGSSQLLVFDKTQSPSFHLTDDGNNKTTLILPKADSYIGIGTNSFIDDLDLYRLSVNGAIRAHRVKVYTDWADYVFEKDYNLPTLEEVENHIKENGHLLDIPSACEVEERGIDLGEMNKLLLQKIEELTLYVIELNKEVKALKQKE
ncbi:hypothetical protein [Flavobacterium filum]|uniref:hypothetical protein n=1 Tax=Flavobacterium filum TaxID=370974 RepID=UPI00040AFA5E|nr:hypothetical protein [Flavobacterium filum]